MKEQDTLAARIARQSQMERSVDYFNLRGITPTVEDLVLTSHVLHKYIMDGWSKDLSEMLQRLDEHINKNY